MNVGQKTFNWKSSLLSKEIQMQIDAIVYGRWQQNFIGSALNVMAVIPSVFFLKLVRNKI